MQNLYFSISLIISSAVSAQQDWFPVDVQADGKKLQYQPLQKVTQVWRLCALLPHGKDHYWWGCPGGWRKRRNARART